MEKDSIDNAIESADPLAAEEAFHQIESRLSLAADAASRAGLLLSKAGIYERAGNQTTTKQSWQFKSSQRFLDIFHGRYRLLTLDRKCGRAKVEAMTMRYRCPATKRSLMAVGADRILTTRAD